MTDSHSITPPPVPERPRYPGEHVAAWPEVPYQSSQSQTPRAAVPVPRGPDHKPDRGRKVPEWLIFAAVVVIGAAVSIWAMIYISGDRSQEVATSAESTPSTEAVPSADESVPTTEAVPSADESVPTTEAVPSADESVPSADEPETEEESAGESSEEAAPSVDHVACPEGTLVEICDAAAFVEQSAGRPFQQFPQVELLDDPEFETRLLADFDADSSSLADSGLVFRSLGLLEPGQDLIAIYRNLLAVGVVGFYDPTDGALVVRGQSFDLYAQSVLVHELVHAHDDQWRDLDRPELEDTVDESAYGFSAVVEGNASRVEEDWISQLTGEEQSRLDAQQFSQFAPEDIEAIQQLPPFIIGLQASPYVDGQRFVEAVLADLGDDGLDALFADPPDSSEVVLDPQLFLNGEGTIEVAAPDPSGSEIMSGTFGELMFETVFGASIDGWGGDQFTTVDTGGAICTTIEVVGDDDELTDGIYVAALRWAETEPNASVQQAQVSGRNGVRIVSCG